MTKQITLEEALKLVSFEHTNTPGWRVRSVNSSIYGAVNGDIYGSVRDIYGAVDGTIYGSVRDVAGNVWGTINGRKWEFVETPREKLERLIQESGDQELIEAFNQQQEGN